MTETRVSTLLALAAAAAVVAYLLAVTAYTSIPFPTYAAVPLALLAVTELVMAKIVRDRIARRASRDARVLHPMQVARSAVVAKASSAGGALLAGGYLGLLAWTLPRRDELLTTGRASLVAGTAALACVVLVVAALLLERACRAPDDSP